MAASHHPIIAREGWPLLTVAALAGLAAFRLDNYVLLMLVALLIVLLILLFRDPHRSVPSQPLAVVSPVDGRVLEVVPTDKGVLERESLRITIRVDNLGAYAARSPAEGKVLNLKDNASAGSRLLGVGGLWVKTDEGDDVVLLMRGPRFIGRPTAFVRYGERVGQGQRCAFLRLASRAEVLVPLISRVAVKPGDRVRAGTSVLATLVHK